MLPALKKQPKYYRKYNTTIHNAHPSSLLLRKPCFFIQHKQKVKPYHLPLLDVNTLPGLFFVVVGP